MTKNDRGEISRAKASLWISIAALVVSIISFAFPLWTQQNVRAAAIEEYVDGVVGIGSSSAYVAQGKAAEGSQASEYASTIGLLWEAVEGSGDDISGIAEGSATSKVGGDYEVCFPSLTVLPDSCSTFGDFEFGDNDRISRFTINGQPVEHLFQAGRYDNTLTSKDNAVQIRAYSAGKLYDTDREEKTLILWFDRSNVEEEFTGELTIASTTSQDGNENTLEVLGSYFPDTVSYWDSYYAAVRLPDSARYLWVCLDGNPEERICEPIYNIR